MRTEITPAGIIARMERLPISRTVLLARILVGSATFFDAFSTLSVAYALPSLARQWHLSPQTIGLIISSSFAGQLIGALFFGWLAERLGRLKVATITIAIYALMSVVCIFAWAAQPLAVFRFIQGIGLGGEVPVGSAYINEFATARNRGRFFMLYELLFPLGLAAAGLFGFWLVPLFGWQAMFVLGAVPAVLVFLLRPLLPELPRWLISKGRIDEADAIVARLEREIERRGTPLPPPIPLGAAPAPRQSRIEWRELFNRVYRRRTFTLWMLWMLTFLILQGIQTWLPTIYTSVFHLPLAKALGYGLVTNNVTLIANVLCALLIDRLGRRTWYILSFLVSTVPLALLCALGAVSAAEVMLLATCGFFFVGSVATSLYLYTGELYPTRFRALGTSIASAWTRAAGAASPMIVGFILASEGLRWVFGYLSLVAFAAAIICILFVSESSGRVLEELSP